MNRPFSLLRLASDNPDREEWNTVERMCGKVERLQRIPVQDNANSLYERRKALKKAQVTEGELQLGRVITVD